MCVCVYEVCEVCVYVCAGVHMYVMCVCLCVLCACVCVEVLVPVWVGVA